MSISLYDENNWQNQVSSTEVPNYYIVDDNKERLILEENSLAEALSNFLVQDYVEELMTNKLSKHRIYAVKKLECWASSEYELYALKVASEADFDPEVRHIAKHIHMKLVIGKK